MPETQDSILGELSENQLDPYTRSCLIEISKWVKFISVIFFSIGGIALLLMLFNADSFSTDDGSVAYKAGFYIGVIIAIILVGGVIGMAFYYLMNFGTLVRRGLSTEDINLVNRGLHSLKRHYVIMGVISLLTLLFTLIQFF